MTTSYYILFVLELATLPCDKESNNELFSDFVTHRMTRDVRVLQNYLHFNYGIFIFSTFLTPYAMSFRVF